MQAAEQACLCYGGRLLGQFVRVQSRLRRHSRAASIQPRQGEAASAHAPVAPAANNFSRWHMHSQNHPASFTCCPVPLTGTADLGVGLLPLQKLVLDDHRQAGTLVLPRRHGAAGVALQQARHTGRHRSQGEQSGFSCTLVGSKACNTEADDQLQTAEPMWPNTMYALQAPLPSLGPRHNITQTGLCAYH